MEIFDYLMHTPHNTNPAIMDQLLIDSQHSDIVINKKSLVKDSYGDYLLPNGLTEDKLRSMLLRGRRVFILNNGFNMLKCTINSLNFGSYKISGNKIEYAEEEA